MNYIEKIIDRIVLSFYNKYNSGYLYELINFVCRTKVYRSRVLKRLFKNYNISSFW